MKSVFALIPVVYMASAIAADPSAPDSELRTPIPSFAPRASATLLYCTESMTADVGEIAEGEDPAKKFDAYIYSKSWNEQRNHSRDFPLRLRFDAKFVYIALGARDGNEVHYGRELPFSVLDDSPSEFFAMYHDADPKGYVETLALNRVAGTLVLSRVNASMYRYQHPYGVLKFEVCEPVAR